MVLGHREAQHQYDRKWEEDNVEKNKKKLDNVEKVRGERNLRFYIFI